jgi:N-terminal half of MaoC dehydratase
VNPAAEGTVYPSVTFVVEPERVAAFRDVFGQTEGVPPTFLTAAEFAALPPIFGDPRLELDFSRVLHGGQEYEYTRAVREGETITVLPRIESIRHKGDNWFMAVVMEMVDDAGVPIAIARSKLIERGDVS